MGGFLGIGGSSAKTDRKNTLEGYGELKNVFNFGMGTSSDLLGTGKGIVSSGVNALDTAKNFWGKILSGNRTDTMQAVAPAVNSINASEDAARTERANMGTGRTGGVASNEVQADTNRRATIDNAVLAARPTAAQETAKIGQAEGSLGNSLLTQALNALGISTDSARALTSTSADSRSESFKENQAVQEQWGQLIGTMLFGF